MTSLSSAIRHYHLLFVTIIFYSVTNIWYDVTIIFYSVTNIWYDVTIICYSVANIWYDVTYIWYDVTYIWYDVTNIWYDVTIRCYSSLSSSIPSLIYDMTSLYRFKIYCTVPTRGGGIPRFNRVPIFFLLFKKFNPTDAIKMRHWSFCFYRWLFDEW